MTSILDNQITQRALAEVECIALGCKIQRIYGMSQNTTGSYRDAIIFSREILGRLGWTHIDDDRADRLERFIVYRILDGKTRYSGVIRRLEALRDKAAADARALRLAA